MRLTVLWGRGECMWEEHYVNRCGQQMLGRLYFPMMATPIYTLFYMFFVKGHVDMFPLKSGVYVLSAWIWGDLWNWVEVMLHEVKGWAIKCNATPTSSPRVLVFGTWSPCGEESQAMWGSHTWVLQPAVPWRSPDYSQHEPLEKWVNTPSDDSKPWSLKPQTDAPDVTKQS